MIRRALRRFSTPALVPVATTTVIDGARAPAPTRALTVATWNISWGQGWGSELSGSAPLRARAEIDRALEQMGDVLRSEGVDVALLQEVDQAAVRSGDVDQARALAVRAGLPYVTFASSWDLAYLPYPVWPPSKHTGRIRSGGAILSRYPLGHAWIELLPKPTQRSALYRAFYPSRYVMGAVLDAGDGLLLPLVNTHLEAFDPPNRRLQAGIVGSRVAALARAGSLVFGGDLNTVPTAAAVRHAYPDEPATDHREDPSFAIIARTPGLRHVLAEDAQAASCSFPAHQPNRLLDHLFVAGEVAVDAARVVTEAGPASDHLPLVARLRLLSRSEPSTKPA